MYLTYEEYQNMGGTLDEAAFNDFEFEAESSIDWYTFSRLQKMTTYPEKVKRCMFSLIKLTTQKANLLGTAPESEEGTVNGIIASQSNDGVTTSFSILSASEAYKLSSDEIGNTIKRYLEGVTDELGRKLLYRGLYPGE